MGVTYIAKRSATSGGTNVASQSILLPDGWQADDICIWFGSVNSSTVTLGLPASGWTFVDTTPATVGSDKLWVAYQRLTNSSAAPTVTLTGGTAKVSQGMVLYRGASTTTAPSVGARFTRSVSQATTVGNGITTTEANELVVHVFIEKSSSSTTVTPGFTATERAKAFTTGGGETSVVSYEEVVATAGATGTRTVTYDVASTVGYAISLALPAAPPPTPTTGNKVYSLTGGVLVQRNTYRLESGLLAD